MKIHVEWDDWISLDQVSSKQDSHDYGLYQIYGAHPVYGSDVLLYVGKADQQKFGVRIPQHDTWVYNRDAGNVKIYLGRLGGNAPISDQEWSDQIDFAEKLLIFSHKPAYNSSNIKTASGIPLDAHVLNWGSYRSLAAEVSAYRYFASSEEYFKTYEMFTGSD